MKCYFNFAILISLVVCISCSKKEALVPAVSKTFPIRVLEVGSDIPLPGAVSINSICLETGYYGCFRWKEDSFIADFQGKVIVVRENFRNHLIKKPGYWRYVNEPDASSIWYINYQPSPKVFYISNGQIDSMLIKLFPVTQITVRVKNTNASATGYFQGNALFETNVTKGEKISLRASIDTTFQYRAFGNASNKMFILRGSPFNDTVSIHTRNIAKGESLNLDFNY